MCLRSTREVCRDYDEPGSKSGMRETVALQVVPQDRPALDQQVFEAAGNGDGLCKFANVEPKAVLLLISSVDEARIALLPMLISQLLRSRYSAQRPPSAKVGNDLAIAVNPTILSR